MIGVSDGRLPFVEAFGPTLQGEGVAAGRNSVFVRFGGCNLSCSWCDSAYTWDSTRHNLREEIHMLSMREVLERTPVAPVVVVTGGEPLLNQNNGAFINLLHAYKDRGCEVHVETNGTITPTQLVCDLVDVFSVSPKLPHAGLHKRSQDPSLNVGWRGLHDRVNAHLKVVVITEDDVKATKSIATGYGWPLERVWVMPEGVTSEVLNTRWPKVAQWATEMGINATHRLHVLAWGDERGH